MSCSSDYLMRWGYMWVRPVTVNVDGLCVCVFRERGGKSLWVNDEWWVMGDLIPYFYYGETGYENKHGSMTVWQELFRYEEETLEDDWWTSSNGARGWFPGIRLCYVHEAWLFYLLLVVYMKYLTQWINFWYCRIIRPASHVVYQDGPNTLKTGNSLRLPW